MRAHVVIACMVVACVSLALGQQNPSECRDRCNLAMCFQVTSNAINVEVNEKIAKALTRAALSTRPGHCGGSAGMAFYRRRIRFLDTCPLWPHPPNRQVVFSCIDRIVAAQSISPSDENHLHTCLNLINTDPAFLRFTHSTQCRYTIPVICNRNLANAAEVESQAMTLKNKGAVIACFLIGNTRVPYDSVFDKICANITQASDYPEIWRDVENMHGDLGCCDDPVPTPAPPGPCDGCKIINGVGYNPHPTRCDCWNRCLFNGTRGGVYHVTNCCQCGMFWSQDLLTCIPAKDINCPTDPCKIASVNAWAYPGNCRAYWTCDGPKSNNALCCPEGQEFSQATQNCVVDTNGDCTDPCVCDLETTTTVCPFRPNPLDRHTYYVTNGPLGRPILMPCAPGTDFDPATCKCSIIVPVPMPPCPADFDLRCTEDPLIDHANNAYIADFGVSVDVNNGQCGFDGNDRLMVPRYANFDWRRRFAIYSHFNGQSNINNDKPLLSNTDCDEPSSVELRLIRSPGPQIEAYIKTTDGPFTVRVAYRPAQANEAFMSYDGTTLRLCVKYADATVDSATAAATGLVLRCKCAVQIGYGWQSRYFSGLIFATRIYINCIPRNNICP